MTADGFPPLSHTGEIPPLVEIDIGDLAAVLTRTHRRTIIDHLSVPSAESISCTDLAQAVAVAEHDRNYTAEQYDCVRIVLRQVHLPTLAQAHIIEHDDRKGTVRRGVNFDAARFALDALEAVGG